MFEDIKDYFEGKRDLSEVLDQNQGPSPKDLVIAASVLLIEVASADQEIAKEEGAEVVNSLAMHFGVPKSDIPALVTLAISAKKEKGKVAEFIDTINSRFSAEQKKQVLTMVWKVGLADGHIDEMEEKFVHHLRNRFDLSEEEGLEAYQEAINDSDESE